MTVSESLNVQAKPPVTREVELTELNRAGNWPPWKKGVNFTLVCLISFVGHFSATVYIPATPLLQGYFHVDQEIINLSIAFFMITFSIGLLIMSSISEVFGRSILAGTSTHFGAFMTFRLLQGLFVGVGLALGGGSCSDLYDSHARGRAMAIYVLCIIAGPATAPILGGFAASHLSWQWIFYILAIMGGVLTLLAVFFLQETFHPPPVEKTPGRLRSILSNLRLPWQVFCRPEITLVLLVQCAVFGWIFLLIVMLPTTLQTTYDLSTDTISVVYIVGGVGDGLGALISGFLSDRLHRLRMLRNRDMTRVEYRLIPVFYLALPFILCGALLYGWSTQTQMVYYMPLCAYALYSFGTTVLLTLTNSYLIEANRRHATTAISLSQFMRNAFAMLFTAISVQIYKQLSVGWVYTVSAITNLTMFSLVILVYYQGPKWRSR